jgi:hypothetical protein
LEPFAKATLSFQVAFAQRAPENGDYLRIWMSRDFGENWDLTWVRSGSSLRSVEDFKESSWSPADTSEWKSFSMNISNTFRRKGTLIKFEFGGDGGNNMFIDAIEISGEYKDQLFLNEPSNGTLGLPEDVVIDWKAVGDVDFYEYQIDEETTFNTEALISGTKDYIDENPENEDTEFFAQGLTRDKKFYWRVRYSKDGVYSDWSDVWNFRISSNGLTVEALEKAPSVLVYPNPAQDYVAVMSAESFITSWGLFDLRGRQLLTATSGERTARLTIDLSGVSPGAYLLVLQQEDGSRTTKRLIVQ